MSETVAGSEPAAAPSEPSRPVLRRRQVALLAGALSAVVLVVVVIALAAGGGGPQGAASVVPADALGFVDVSLDRAQPVVARGLALARRFPDFAHLGTSVITRVGAILTGGHPAGAASRILPWAGREGALALLNTPTATAGSLLILDVADPARARAFLRAEGATRRGSDHGVALYGYPSGTELAFVSHYLVAGQDAGVRAAIAVGAGAAPSLAGAGAYRRAMATTRPGRVLSAYASAAGVQRLLAPRGGLIGALGQLLYSPALQGAGLGLVPTATGARIDIDLALDPTLEHLHPATPAFSPTLEHVLPAGSILMLDVRGLNRLAPALLGAGATAGIAGGIQPLLARLGSALRAEGVDVPAVTALFAGETAVGLVPNGASTTLVVVTRTAHPAQVRSQLAQLEIPLAQLFQPPSAGPGQVGEFNERTVAGVTDHQLGLANGLELDYAVFDGLVVISTSSAGVADVARHARSLADDPAYRAVLGARTGPVSALMYAALPQVVALGRRTDLISGAGFDRLAPDLAAVQGAGLTVHRVGGRTEVQITLRLP